MVLLDGEKLRMGLAHRDPVNTNAPGQQNNKNGPPGPVGNKKGPPTVVATTAEAPTTSSIQTPPLASPFSSATSPPPASFTSTSTSPFTSPPTISAVPITASTSEVSPSIPSPSATSTSVTLTPSTYYEMSLATSTPSLVKTLETTGASTSSSATPLTTGLASFPPSNVAQVRYSALGPGQKAGIAVGIIAGVAFVMTLICFLFKWRRSKIPKAVPCLGRRLPSPQGNFPWLSRTQTPAEMPDSPLAPEAGSRGSLGWDYRSTFARPTATEKSRRSLPRSLRRLVRFNPLGQNPVIPREGTSSRNSFASFFSRRSTASAARSVIDVESPPAIPPLPTGLSTPRLPVISVYRGSVQSNTNEFLRSQTISAEVIPPAFHCPWLYRNSHTTLAPVESGTHSFKSMPGWVRFHYPRREPNDSTALREPLTPHHAPPPISPGSWLKAKILRSSQSTTASTEKRESQTGSDIGDEPASIESPVLGPSRWKQTQVGLRTSCESVKSLMVEIQEPRQI